VSRPDATVIGRVRHVLGSTVTVELDPKMAGVSPIYRGAVLSVGQIGSLVRLPQGLVDLVGSVSLVGIAELAGRLQPVDEAQRGERWLQVQLIGEIHRATSTFHRGVGSFPALDDEVHFATVDDLRAVYPPPGANSLRIGTLSAAEELPVCLNASKLVVRHAAIVGSTGSGKTSAVASILQSFARGGWTSANILVVDPHGEYKKALEGNSSVRSVLGEKEGALHVPFWALPAVDILRIFAGTTGSNAFSNRFAEFVAEARRDFAKTATWLKLEPTAITADTPIPFGIREVWHKLDAENRETRAVKADPATAAACLLHPGNPDELQSATYKPYAPGGATPFQGPYFGVHGTMPDSLRLGLKDPRLQFFLEPEGTPEGPDPLIEVVRDWLGRKSPISVLDFAGVSPVAADLAIGVILNLIFELCVRSNSDGPGIGRPQPVFVVLEEAHRYLGSHASALTRDSANRIAREGRKYGVGLLMVTQRPTELPDTALAQCGTLVALRLSNSSDQGTIKSALPDSVAGLAAVLPSLRTGEAIVSGEGLLIPSRTMLDLPDPLPHAEDPSLEPWRGEKALPDVSGPLASWRGQYEE